MGKAGAAAEKKVGGWPAGSEQREKMQRVGGSNPCDFFLNPSLMHAVNADVSKVFKKVCSLSALAHADLRCSLPCLQLQIMKPSQNKSDTQICLPNFVPREI